MLTLTIDFLLTTGASDLLQSETGKSRPPIDNPPLYNPFCYFISLPLGQEKTLNLQVVEDLERLLCI
jgi:hypothetical protein